MSSSDSTTGQVSAAAAEVYEDFFVPALFRQWPMQMLDAAIVGSGHRVLDLGCGTGVVSRAAAERVGAGGQVVGLDVNEGMLSVARRVSKDVSWRQGRAEDLPFADGSFDRIICQFALMFFSDRARALAEMARVLAPGGSVALATWSSVEESPGYASMVALLRRVIGDHAADALLAPFCLGDPNLLHTLMVPVFPDVAISRHAGEATFESLEAWLHTDIRGWTLADMIDDDQYGRLLTEARSELSRFVDASGRVRFPAPALIAVARSPRPTR